MKANLVIIFMLISFIGLAQQNNAELKQLADDDQEARNNPHIDWKKLNAEDSLRRVRIFELIAENKLKTGVDYLHAGIVFQHGNDTIASAMAVKCFGKALELDSTLNRWWYAAAVDRDLMRRKQPQIYGTQFIQDSATGKFRRYEIDTTKITDQQRVYYYVETLAAQKEKEWRMNLKPIAAEYKENNSIDKTIQSIQLQYEQGRLSAFSLEQEINSFGYELIHQNKKDEALSIFKLNTELYPEAYNTWDSYGECLWQLGKKKEALKAYKKSLKLNPDSKNAKEILDK